MAVQSDLYQRQNVTQKSWLSVLVSKPVTSGYGPLRCLQDLACDRLGPPLVAAPLFHPHFRKRRIGDGTKAPRLEVVGQLSPVKR